MNRTARLLVALWILAIVGGCQNPSRQSTVVQLRTLNDSGVTGTVTLVDTGDGRTQVQVRVDPSDNLDMPAHIHPGSCDNLIPQPKHPLENVVNGTSTTIVRASLSARYPPSRSYYSCSRVKRATRSSEACSSRRSRAFSTPRCSSTRPRAARRYSMLLVASSSRSCLGSWRR